MRLSAKNFTTKQIGSWWRVVGPGGKLLDGKYRLQSQALSALKKIVDDMLTERNFGYLKDASNRINQKLEKELQNEKEETDDGKRTDDQKGHDEGHDGRQEKNEIIPETKKEKIVRRPTKTTSQLKKKFNV